MVPSRNTASRQNTYWNKARSAVWLPRNIKFVASFYHWWNNQLLLSRQQRQGRLRDPTGSSQTCWSTFEPAAIRWLQAFYDDVVTTAMIPKIWRSANVIAIRKSGKPLDDPTSYRPISLLCCCYKFMERLLLTRLAPIFESVIPPEQAGFRKKRNTCDQVLALTILHRVRVSKEDQDRRCADRPDRCVWHCLTGWAHDEVIESH